MNNESKLENRKLLIVRLLIFLILAFAFCNIPQILFFSNNPYYNEEGEIAAGTSLLLAFNMLAPTFAMLIVRGVTGEGFQLSGKDSMLLGIRFENRKWILFALALLVPWFTHDMGVIMDMLVFKGAFDPTVLDPGMKKIIWSIPAICLTSGVVGSIGGLGEELGWRGYMMPKLEKLMGIKVAVIVGGFIWGVWHYVGIAYGHNFGLDYWGAPWLGMLIFTVFTIIENAFLTYITKQSGSVWPAAFSHAVNNTGVTILGMMLNSEHIPVFENTFGILAMIPMAVVGVICFFLMGKGEKKSFH